MREKGSNKFLRNVGTNLHGITSHEISICKNRKLYCSSFLPSHFFPFFSCSNFVLFLPFFISFFVSSPAICVHVTCVGPGNTSPQPALILSSPSDPTVPSNVFLSPSVEMSGYSLNQTTSVCFHPMLKASWHNRRTGK
jgi:hypothetical protein